ncbi:hypothetical protein [Geopseudomonas aromaticivorans]
MKRSNPSVILDFMAACQLDGNDLILPSRDDFDLPAPDYSKFKRLIEGVGGAYSNGKNLFSFPFPPAALIERLGSGEQYQQALQFFPTPAVLARQLLANMPIGRDYRWLEPHGGRAALAEAIRELQGNLPCEIHTCELDPFNQEVLRSKGFKVLGGDFLAFHTLPSEKYDCVVANPPFSNGQYITHLNHAYDQLKPGGSFAFIAPTTWRQPRNGREEEFRDFFEAHSHTIEKVPAGAFRESGTAIDTVIIAGHRPAYDYSYLYQRPRDDHQQAAPRWAATALEEAIVEVREFFQYIDLYHNPSLQEVRFAAANLGFQPTQEFGMAIMEALKPSVERQFEVSAAREPEPTPAPAPAPMLSEIPDFEF